MKKSRRDERIIETGVGIVQLTVSGLKIKIFE
jgi:hypothetical protein